jgi:tetratricopeptide (TPR) repeat protein
MRRFATTMVLLVLLAWPGTARSAEDPEWLVRLKAWSDAVASHSPGELDAAVAELAGWSASELRETASDFLTLRRALAAATRQPALPGGRAAADHRLKHREYAVSVNQLRDLKVFDGRLATDRNRVLKLAAMLHADVAMLAPIDRSTQESGSARVVRSEDGSVTGYQGLSMHWSVGRQFLDAVEPEPAAESFVRLWYHATSAFMFEAADLANTSQHVARAVDVLPDDANAHYEAGFFHQAMASPTTLAVVRAEQRDDLHMGRRRRPGMDAKDHLKAAARLFRRAVLLDPAHAEAEVRLGYVLIELGETAEAATHLRRAVASAQHSNLRYLGLMALGRAESRLARREDAIRAWTEAARLVPSAQSPGIALAAAASLGGERSAAGQSINHVS